MHCLWPAPRSLRFTTPELDFPVHTRPKENVEEVDRSGDLVARQACDGCTMRAVYVGVVETCLDAGAIRSQTLVYAAFFCVYMESRSLVRQEVHSADGNVVRLAVTAVRELDEVLRVSQHVDQPTIDLPVRVRRDEIVRVLRTNNLHVVYWVEVAAKGRSSGLQHW